MARRNVSSAAVAHPALPGCDPVSLAALGLECGPNDLAERIAGIDEAGRGCLAGPVVAAAVILPQTFDLPGLTDSKALSATRREELERGIRAQALAWSLGLAWPAEIDAVNILQATLRAMERAVRTLSATPRLLLIDGDKTTTCALPQRAIIGGDGLVPAISAASILAKTFRDKLMTQFDRRYPGYNFPRHKGYGTAEHLEALRQLGPCRLHRITFRGVLPQTPIRTPQPDPVAAAPVKDLQPCRLPGLDPHST